MLQALDLKKEREKTDALLSEMLPGHIVSMLKLGKEPKPQIYKYEELMFGILYSFFFQKIFTLNITNITN